MPVREFRYASPRIGSSRAVQRPCRTACGQSHDGRARVQMGIAMSELATNGPEWWHTTTIYQIYPRSFQGSNRDGIGDLRGILRRLDHVTQLGIGTIWLSPIFRSPMVDFGYDVSDHTEVDPLFGTLADFDELLHAVHRRGLKLLLVLVPNHTS